MGSTAFRSLCSFSALKAAIKCLMLHSIFSSSLVEVEYSSSQWPDLMGDGQGRLHICALFMCFGRGEGFGNLAPDLRTEAEAKM